MTSLVTVQMEAPGGVEPPTNSLGNCCSIQLSYGATQPRRLIFSHSFRDHRSIPEANKATAISRR